MATNTNLNDCNKINIKPTESEELYTTTYSLRSSDSKSERVVTPGTSFELFRNNTTAVELIVKEVNKHSKPNKLVNKRTGEPRDKIERLLAEIEQLKSELNNANKKLILAGKDYQSLVLELKKQLDVLTRREIDEQTKNVTLQLENEKLKALLDSKTNVIDKLKKELTDMKRTLKFAVKSIALSQYIPEGVGYSSDAEYESFEKGLKKESQAKFFVNLEGLCPGAGGCGGIAECKSPPSQPPSPQSLQTEGQKPPAKDTDRTF